MENPNKILVSICMITYNHERFLAEAINGVLDQKIDSGFELVVSDDCSTDYSYEIVDSFVSNHPLGNRIRYIRHKTNLGMSENFHWTLMQCKGEYIAYCEGDDYWTDTRKLQKQIDYLQSNKSLSFAFHRTTLYYQNSKISKADHNDRFFKKNKSLIEVDGFTLANGWQIGMQTLVFRKAYISNLNISDFNYFRDVHLLAHLLEYGNGACLNFFGSVYRIHNEGVHSRNSKFENLKTGYACFEELFKCYKKNYQKLILKNYLHELIQFQIKGNNYQEAVYYLKKLMSLEFSLKVLAYYLKELILSTARR
ncbi:glycosyltransferase [uncultured Algoriphagus sp.]|uniref:glycosyltransferase family 2 protein n=1 Tax=uncultured Algoriphagus sp. TaxID=417365 RepID=UPI00258C2763|nr:glycosyltransferase [uncultured Algoriphagus sp.]